MKHIKNLKKWGIYELNNKEKEEFRFTHAVIHPDTMESYGPQGANCLTPDDSDWNCDSLKEAIDWIKNY